MALFGSSAGIHFKEPWQFMPYCATASALQTYTTADANNASNTTAFFTEMARRGLQDTTDWTANTYKTLLNVSSGKGLVACLVGPTAGGAATTTFRITVDGVQDEIAVTGLASGERAVLIKGGVNLNSAFTTAGGFQFSGNEALDADKATFGAIQGSPAFITPWRMIDALGTPCLIFTASLLIEAKHSASITNSTATAYSAVMYRLGL